MSHRAVYDTMVFFQWASLPEGRQHGTVRAVLAGEIQLCLSPELLSEIEDLLGRPAIRSRSPALSEERVQQFFNQLIRYGSMFPEIPNVFTWPQHPDDDHLFNLAIHAKAKYVVTWESRLLQLPNSPSPAAKLLHEMAPGLVIVTPKELADILKVQAPKSSAAE